MDKLRPVWATIKKQHFWILCGVIVVVSLVTWTKATGDLDVQIKDRKTKLDGAFSSVRSICDQPNHPNEGVIKATNDKHEQLKGDVYTAWSKLYNEQKSKNQLPDLSADFDTEFWKLWGPLEKLDGASHRDDMTARSRSEYVDNIEKYFPKLFKLIDYRRQESPDEEAGSEGPARDKPRWTGIVYWDTADKTLARFKKWETNMPSTLHVMLAQEDLWVYEALLRIIKNTNAGAKDHKRANIKRIAAMEIGDEAVQSWRKTEQNILRLGEGSAVAGPPVPVTGPPGPPGAAKAEPSPLANRYVDDKGRPVADPAKQPYAEFRMMPINLRVQIEQMAIPRLLAECANSSMPIDVRSLRLFMEESSAMDTSAVLQARPGAGGPMGAPRGPMGGPGAMIWHAPSTGMGMPMGPHGMAAPPVGAGDVHVTQDEESADTATPTVPLEIQGIIYIYNPPDIAKVGTGVGMKGKPKAAAPAKGGHP